MPVGVPAIEPFGEPRPATESPVGKTPLYTPHWLSDVLPPLTARVWLYGDLFAVIEQYIIVIGINDFSTKKSKVSCFIRIVFTTKDSKQCQ
jgi:hypothetical protein